MIQKIIAIIITLFLCSQNVVLAQSKPIRDKSKDKTTKVQTRSKKSTSRQKKYGTATKKKSNNASYKTNQYKQWEEEQEYYDNAVYQWTIEAFEDYLYEYPNGRYAQQANDHIAEIRLSSEQSYFDSVCKKGELSGYEEYLNRYPYGRHVSEIKDRIADYERWNTAKSINSISSYKDYLNNSNQKKYLTEQANNAIQALELANKTKSEEEWNRIKNSSSKYAFESYINNYPGSKYAEEARKKIHIIQGIDYYNSGNYKSAYQEFKSAGGRYALDYSTQTKYDKCEEQIAYQELSEYSSENELSSFLSKYPYSQYKTNVMNLLAIAKAKQLNMYSSEYNFNNVLSYAQDNLTRSRVKGYIDNCKKARSRYNRQQRHERIMANGGYVGFGIDLWDIGTNIFTSEDSRLNHVAYYNFAATFRIGNFKTPVYLELGVKPGWLIWNSTMVKLENFFKEASTKFHMPVFAKLKINLFNAWGNTKFYINGIGHYNAIRAEELESEFSVGGGFGVAGRHWDWQILYYRQDLDKDKIYNKNDIRYLGTSLGYFF